MNVTSDKYKTRSLQCHNYSRGQCSVSHSISMKKAEAALMQGLETALELKQFTITPQKPKKTTPTEVDYDKLIAVEERRLARAKEAYLAEIDTLEDYKKHKEEAGARIKELEAKRDETSEATIDMDSFASKVMGVLEFIKDENVSETAKNEALRTIIEKMVYEKANGNLAIFFHAI